MLLKEENKVKKENKNKNKTLTKQYKEDLKICFMLYACHPGGGGGIYMLVNFLASFSCTRLTAPMSPRVNASYILLFNRVCSLFY